MNDDWDGALRPGVAWGSAPSARRSGQALAPWTPSGSTENCVRFLLLMNDDLLGPGLQSRLSAAGHEVRWLRQLPASLPDAGDHDAVIVDLESVSRADMAWKLALQSLEAPWPVLVVSGPDASIGASARSIPTSDVDHWAGRALALAEQANSRSPSQWLGGELLLDPRRQTVRLNGTLVELTPLERQVITLLASHPERAVPRSDIARLIGGASEASDNAVAVHLYNLRRKLGRHAIETIRGRGFRLRP